MPDTLERARGAATDISWPSGLRLRHGARRVQDAALRVVDPRALRRLELVDREFDRTVTELERAAGRTRAAAAHRPITPLPDVLAESAIGIGAALAIGMGKLVGRTPAGTTAVAAPTVLVLATLALVLLVVGEVIARRERSTSTVRVLFLWFVPVSALVAAVAVRVRLAADGTTPAGVGAVVASVLVLGVAVVIAIGATRRREPDDGITLWSRLGPDERAGLAVATTTAQDRARSALDGLDEPSRAAFTDAYAAGLAAVAGRDAHLRPAVRRLRTLDWAAGRYDTKGE